MSKPEQQPVSYAFWGMVAAGVLAAVFLIYQVVTLSQQLQAKTGEQAQTATELSNKTLALTEAENTINTLTEELEELTEELDDAERDLRREKNKNDEFEDQIDDLSGVVKDLDKLSKTDEELLQKYSKVYFLNENYIPSKIRQIKDKYVLEGKDAQFFHGDALDFLEDMLDEAEDDNIDLKVISAYRSFDHQHELKGQFTTLYGEGANAFSADQGYSEHQLGTTVDLTDPATGGTYQSFAQTEAYEWLLKNAHKYGFTLSYPEDNSFYIFEPWHWRFVGVDLAKDLERDNAHFYDWEQREIDKYLLNIFD